MTLRAIFPLLSHLVLFFLPFCCQKFLCWRKCLFVGMSQFFADAKIFLFGICLSGAPFPSVINHWKGKLGGSFIGPLFFSSVVPKQETRTRNWNQKRSGEKINSYATPYLFVGSCRIHFCMACREITFLREKGWLVGHRGKLGTGVLFGRVETGLWPKMEGGYGCCWAIWFHEVLHPTTDIRSNIVVMIKKWPSGKTTCQKIIISGYPSLKDERF